MEQLWVRREAGAGFGDGLCGLSCARLSVGPSEAAGRTWFLEDAFAKALVSGRFASGAGGACHFAVRVLVAVSHGPMW